LKEFVDGIGISSVTKNTTIGPLAGIWPATLRFQCSMLTRATESSCRALASYRKHSVAQLVAALHGIAGPQVKGSIPARELIVAFFVQSTNIFNIIL
jgi:hypothetical protein